MFRKSLEDFSEDNSPKMVIDLRKPEDYKKETIPGAINVQQKGFFQYASRLPRNKRIYLFCYTGETSDEYAEHFSKRGYDIYSIEEGYHAYLRYKLKKMMP